MTCVLGIFIYQFDFFVLVAFNTSETVIAKYIYIYVGTFNPTVLELDV